MSQRNLWPPSSHRGDPAPAQQAEARITRSGKRQTQCDLVLELVRKNPGKTAIELGELSGLGHVPAQRRLSDLKNLDKVHNGGTRAYAGRRISTWYPTKLE